MLIENSTMSEAGASKTPSGDTNYICIQEFTD